MTPLPAFQVQNAAGGNLFNIDSTNSNITVNGAGSFINSSNAVTAFRLQNAGGVNNLSVTTLNLIPNASFETGVLNTDNTVTGWAKKLGSETSIKTQNSNAQYGVNSMEVVTTTTAQEGVKYNYTFAPSTQYTSVSTPN
ncbi:MAG: hypothetical protein WDN27_03865 [Candidatus Saccharibacteria bacterium]